MYGWLLYWVGSFFINTWAVLLGFFVQLEIIKCLTKVEVGGELIVYLVNKEAE